MLITISWQISRRPPISGILLIAKFQTLEFCNFALLTDMLSEIVGKAVGGEDVDSHPRGGARGLIFTR